MHAFSLASFDLVLRGALLAVLLLLASLFLREPSSRGHWRIGAWLMVGLAIGGLNAMPAFQREVESTVRAPLTAVANANAVLFWLFARALFDESFQWSRRHTLMWGTIAALSVVECTILKPSGSALMPVVGQLLRWQPMVFALLALQATLHEASDDLLEWRRSLRVHIVAGGALYSLFTVVVHATPSLDEAMAVVDATLLFALVVFVSWQVLRLSSERVVRAEPAYSSSPTLPAPSPAAAVPVVPLDADEERLAAALDRQMTQERAYRTENLNIATLASRLEVPEYRLRKLINQRLGHRNFSAYVNGFRLAEVKNALADPSQCDVPILTIAMDAGFGSLGPFNRAFKVETGVTPTEFRRRANQPAK